MSKQLEPLFSNQAVEDFGAALRKAIHEAEDYSSLIEMEYVETAEQFAEAIKKFLRRYEAYARKYRRRRPLHESLDEIMRLVDQHGVRVVRAALISHALVKGSKREEEEEEKE